MAASSQPLHAVIDATHANALAAAGGLTLAQRMLFVLRRAGIARADLVTPVGSSSKFAALRVPSGLELRLVPADAPTEPGGAGSILVVAAHLVVSVSTMRHFVEQTFEGGPARAFLGETALPLLWCRVGQLEEALRRLRERRSAVAGEIRPLRLEASGAVAVLAASETELIEAERALLSALGRPDDGAFTRLVDRKISAAITRRLAVTGLSPSAVTALSILVGVAGGLILAAGGYSSGVLGSFLFLVSTILDGCDGELARLKFQESRLGAILDIVGDNIVHIAVFGGLALGLYRAHPGLPLQSAAVALVLGLLTAMATTYWCVFWREPTPGQRKLFNAFASREFVYLMLLLAAAGRLLWFFWLALVGTYIFSAALLLLGWREGKSHACTSQ